ncbi:unnamed protein product [Sphagnum jensenii]|uniref:Uncharacterized protein n=1 Tax=Sphagnum jensenii TaxID=128206 RepID=A0ABP1BWF2_9BRYO
MGSDSGDAQAKDMSVVVREARPSSISTDLMLKTSVSSGLFFPQAASSIISETASAEPADHAMSSWPVDGHDIFCSSFVDLRPACFSSGD